MKLSKPEPLPFVYSPGRKFEKQKLDLNYLANLLPYLIAASLFLET